MTDLTNDTEKIGLGGSALNDGLGGLEKIIKMNTGVREDGTVDDLDIETYYQPCKGILTDHDLQCVRVLSDNGATDAETRVLFDTLIDDGWIPPSPPLPIDAEIPTLERMRELFNPNVVRVMRHPE